MTLVSRQGIKQTLKRSQQICGMTGMNKIIACLREMNGLTKTQIKGFFSRLKAKRRRKQCSAKEVDCECKELMQENEEYERKELIAEIAKEIKPQHPISYDAFNLCQYAKENKLSKCGNAERNLPSFCHTF